MRLLIAILSCLTLAACLTEGGVFVESSARFSPASEDPVILDGPEVDQADEPISGTDQLEEPDSTPTEFDAEAPDSQPESDQGGDSSFILVDGGPDGWRDRDAGELPEPELFTFVVYGDSQFSTTSCTSGVSERLAIPQVIMDLDPNFILHTGDLVNDGWEDGAYDRFRTCYADMLALIPLFPTMGNHDAGSGGITQYKTFLEWQLFERNPEVTPGAYSAEFPLWYEDDPIEWSTDRSDPSDRDLLPSGVTWKTYYAFRHQNAYFISFEQGTRWWTQTPKPWLERHLSAARSDPAIDHLFVFMHHPMYSTVMAELDSGECTQPVRIEYEELFAQYDVTMVFSGHVHSYDRFHVPDDQTPTRTDQPPASYLMEGQDIHYIVTGGGGGPLTNGCDPFPLRQELSYEYSQARGCFYHLLLVAVEGQTIEITVWRVEGDAVEYEAQMVDQFLVEAVR